MNLTTLVERACLESGYNDTDDVAAGKKFARHWDEHIWNAALWKDALVACDVAVSPATNDDHAEGIVFLPEVIDRVVAVRCANNQMAVRGQEHHYQMDYDAFAASGQPVEFHILQPAWFKWRATGILNYIFCAGQTADADSEIKIVWETNGVRSTTRTTIGAGESSTAAQLVAEVGGSLTVLALYKPETDEAVYFVKEGDTSSVGNAIVTLAATKTTSPSYQRLRLLPMPTAAFTLKVLGKAKYEPLDFDQQEPSLRNCTQALLAFIRGSLKRRGGEIGAAQLEVQEANALLRQVMQIEALQAANNQRFMPEAGYGPDHGLGPMGLT